MFVQYREIHLEVLL